MNISTNNVNFNGKKEVLYGLTKAAQEAQKMNINKIQSMGPRPVFKDIEVNQSQGALNAYCDMITKDTAFTATLKDLSTEAISRLKEILSPIRNEFAKLYPQSDFKKALNKAVKKAKIDDVTDYHDFLNKIK